MFVESLLEFYHVLAKVILEGGWVIFGMALLYMFYKMYMDYINLRWFQRQKWVFLKIVGPRDSEKSQLTFEQMFNQIHSMHSSFNFVEKYIMGDMQIWFTWEITSIGGAIANYVSVIERHRDTIEAAIYSQFPDAEIGETEDYMPKLPHWHPDADFDIYAFDFIQKKDPAYPIRTYREFEHSTAETFVDPVVGIWEELGKINQHEMFIMQYIFKPLDDDWKKHAQHLVDKLKGAPEHSSEPTLIGEIFRRSLRGLVNIFIPGSPVEEGPVHHDTPPRSQMIFLTDQERGSLQAVETKLSKLSYAVKIRCLYIAPKAKFTPGPIYTAVIGAIKSVTSSHLNALKPDTDHWTKVKPWLLPKWEKPIIQLRLNHRKLHFLHAMRLRWFFGGPHAAILNTEEIATILHFPTLESKVPPVEKVQAVKAQPPAELPVAE